MAKDSLKKASTPEPFSRSRTSNWVARGGGLPAYIQHIAHDLMQKRGKSESNAIQMAIGIVKNWAAGKGKVDANTRAAAAKALAEWEKLKAKNKAKGAAKGAASAVKEVPVEALAPADRAIVEAYEPPRFLFAELSPDEIGDLSVLEAKLSAKQRRNLNKSDFAIPEKAPGPGSYPIHDRTHAEKALQLCGGKPEEGRVRAAVYRKWPDMKPKGKSKS